MDRHTSNELEEALALEDRASATRKAVLSDRDFMAGVRRALAESTNGEAGKPWNEVKKELGIV